MNNTIRNISTVNLPDATMLSAAYNGSGASPIGRAVSSTEVASTSTCALLTNTHVVYSVMSSKDSG